jgi:hypothetical protein
VLGCKINSKNRSEVSDRKFRVEAAPEQLEFCITKTLAMKKIYLISLLLASCTARAFQPAGDSATITPIKATRAYTITTRVHTMGLFMYMGKVVNHNPAADIFFNTTGPKGWGISAFKVVDVNDIHSNNNFAFAFISKTFHLGDRLTATPFIGGGLEQQHGFVSHGSDVMLQLQSGYRINKKLTIDHIAIFNNVLFYTEFSDWTNRFRLMYSDGHVDITGFFWSNNALIDKASYTSTGMSIFYNRVPVAKRLWLGAGLTTLATVNSSNPEVLPAQTGIQFSTALTFK